MEKHLGQSKVPDLIGHEGIQEGVTMVQASIDNIRGLLTTIKNGANPPVCSGVETVPCYLSLADTLEQTPSVLAEQASEISSLVKDITIALNLRLQQ